jgi:glycogen debranching enzyme
MAQMAQAIDHDPAFYAQHAADVRRKINTLLWVGAEEPKDWTAIAQERKEWLYTLKRIETELVERPFYLPYVAFRDYADRFDTFGNLIAIIFGVADQTKANKILDYVHSTGLNEPYPVRVLYPVLYPGDKDWREYYRVRNLNQPHHYHNGGIWPYIGGFYVAALVQAGRLNEARTQLDKLAAMNWAARSGEWGFNEWFHGESGRAMGYDGQSWSAALFIYAANAVRHGQLHVFNHDNGWKHG